VLSPPGMISPSISASCSGLRTSTASISVISPLASPEAPPRLARPHPSRALMCKAKSPCSASTPIFTRLPAARLQELRLGELGGLDAGHRLAEILADLDEDVGILEVRGGLHDRLGPLGRILGLEDPRAHEH